MLHNYLNIAHRLECGEHEHEAEAQNEYVDEFWIHCLALLLVS